MADNINYFEEVNNKINYANILSKIPEQNRALAIDLLNKRNEIKTKNTLLAFWQLKRIDKKIDKLKTKK